VTVVVPSPHAGVVFVSHAGACGSRQRVSASRIPL